MKINIDSYLKRKSKKYFLYGKLSKYKEQLQNFNRFKINKISLYEKKWKDIKKKYQKVCIYGIEFVGIGETVPRLFMHLRNIKNRNKEYSVVLPTFFENYVGGIFNERIFDIFGKYINFITKDNIDFWQYVFIVHSNRVSIISFDRYKHREAKLVNVREGYTIIPFSKKLSAYAEKRLRIMGINGEYICLHAREVSIKEKVFCDYPSTSVSDVDINSFRLAVRYMRNLGFQAIRMGKYESRECTIKNVIDYSNLFYDELMDFYLTANCKFLIGCESGLTVIPAFWGRPILMTNVNAFCYGFESLAITEYDLYIPKKFYSIKKKRFLNLMEMLDESNKLDRYDERFIKEGIEWVDNTEEEILNATIEMNEKMNHMWVETEEEKQCMEKYWNIINIWKSRHKTCFTRKCAGAKGYNMISIPICYSFLKNNLYLIDVNI